MLLLTFLRWLETSPTRSVWPSGKSASPAGWLNEALAPVPSAKLALPEPATVVTVPVAISTRRTRWLAYSVTYRYTPAGEISMPLGSLKAASMPVPSA